MDRELLLFAFLVIIGGATLIVAGLRAATAVGDDAIAVESQAWRALVAPLAPAAIVIAAVIGWAAFEPADAEAMPWPWFVASAPVALLWLRAALRALRSACAHAPCDAADTHGLWKPRVRISPRLAAMLDDHALAAALAHERAHARHRDPLRILIAQLVTDLQGTARARQRLARWRAALELARDDEARRSGIEGADLAAALVAATRLRAAPGAVAHLKGDASFLRMRIERLLRPLPRRNPVRVRSARALVIACAGSVAVGALAGEHVVRLMLTGSP